MNNTMNTRPAPAATDTGLNLNIDKEWFEKKAAQEGDLEIGAGRRSKTVNLSKEDIAEYERVLFEALPQWAQDELTRLRALVAKPATDTGLVTIGFVPTMFVEGKGEGYSDIFRSVRISENHVAVVTRSQAEKLLATERVETERLADDYQAIREQLHRGWQECCALKADNAAQAARIKELEQALETEKTLSRGDWACQREVDQMSIKVEALEAKLAAAEKALEAIEDHAARCFSLSTHSTIALAYLQDIQDEARAALGGKPS